MSFSSNQYSFRELFRIANRIENPSLGEPVNIVMVQPDTSYLEDAATLQDSHRRKRKIKTLESDEDKLRMWVSLMSNKVSSSAMDLYDENILKPKVCMYLNV